jgi:membrane-bound lytic murein transglycosylase D
MEQKVKGKVFFILFLVFTAYNNCFSAEFINKGPGGINDSPDKQDPDILYEYRIAKLNETSPVKLDYNSEVRKYIELFTGPRKNDFAKIIGLSALYFPIFDEYLDRFNLPLELKYLTVVESSLNPQATSSSGAAGLWQFLFNTGDLFDLQINSYIDERRDPYKSTEAACRYLAYLYNTFYDWQLVLSSYNGGPGEVRKAIERNNGRTDYWLIRNSLSEQAKNYVPAFIAAVYVMNYYKEHGIVPVKPQYNYTDIDTLHVTYAVSFEQISALTGFPQEGIRFLNPVYRRDVIPGIASGAVIVLPEETALKYLKMENKIIGFTPPVIDYAAMLSKGADTEGKTSIVHEVKPGEYLHKIAVRYKCTIENIKLWNNLNDNDTLQPGQKLVIWVEDD